MTRSDPKTRSDPMTVAQRPERLAVAFSRLLRGHGVRVPAGASLIYAEAISVLGFSRIGPAGTGPGGPPS